MREIGKYKTMFFARYSGEFIFYTLLTVYLKDKGFSGTEVGAMLSFSPIILALSMPIWLALDNGKFRKLLIIAATASVIALEYVITYAQQFALLAVFMVIYSIVRSPLSSSLDSMAYVYCVESKREYSSVRIWGSAGYIAAILAGSYIYGYVDFIWIVGLSTVILIAFVGIFMYTAPLGIDGGRKKPSDHDFGLLMRNKEYLLFLVIQTVSISLVSVNNSYDILYQQSRGMDTSLFGISTLLRVGAEICTMYLLGKRKIGFRYLYLSVPFMMLTQCISYFLGAPIWSVFAVTLFTGTASGILIYLGNKYISIIVRPRNITIATYIMVITNNLIFALFLFLGGIVIDYLDINFIYLFTGAAFVIIAAFVAFFVRKDPVAKTERADSLTLTD